MKLDSVIYIYIYILCVYIYIYYVYIYIHENQEPFGSTQIPTVVILRIIRMLVIATSSFQGFISSLAPSGHLDACGTFSA